MKLQRVVALIAILSFAGAAQAQTVVTAAPSAAEAKAVTEAAPAAEAKPVQAKAVEAKAVETKVTETKTVETKAIEASATGTKGSSVLTPAAEDKIDSIRNKRQDAESATSEKAEEKIESDRLKDEEQRANKLFGDRTETASPGTAAQAAPAAPAPVVILVPAQQTPIQAPAQTPVAQPAEKAESVRVLAPVAAQPEEDAKPEVGSLRKFYVGGILAAPEYNASNVKTNYGLGVTVGTFLDEHNAIEFSFLYSDYYVDTFWRYGLYTEMTQYDLQAAYKYYLLAGPIKPYVGATLSYIMRDYQDRVKSGLYYQYNPSSATANTNAVDAGLTAGLDFNVTKSFMLGLGFDYNHNVMNSNNDFTSQYNLQPGDTKAIEEIDYYVVKLTAKILF